MDIATIYWHKMRAGSMTDGPDGPRAVLWLSGCSLHCAGCQNQHLWTRTEDQKQSVSSTVVRLRQLAGGRPLTITGGEPFDQTWGLSCLLFSLRAMDASDGVRRNIILYTGYTWRQLWCRLAEGDAALKLCLESIDVLVDGPYMQDQDTDGMQYRGSANQRVIDVPATIEAGGMVNPERIIELDWDSAQEVQIVDGFIVMTGAAFKALGLAGKVKMAPRCGQAGE